MYRTLGAQMTNSCVSRCVSVVRVLRVNARSGHAGHAAKSPYPCGFQRVSPACPERLTRDTLEAPIHAGFSVSPVHPYGGSVRLTRNTPDGQSGHGNTGTKYRNVPRAHARWQIGFAARRAYGAWTSPTGAPPLHFLSRAWALLSHGRRPRFTAYSPLYGSNPGPVCPLGGMSNPSINPQ